MHGADAVLDTFGARDRVHAHPRSSADRSSRQRAARCADRQRGPGRQYGANMRPWKAPISEPAETEAHEARRTS